MKTVFRALALVALLFATPLAAPRADAAPNAKVEDAARELISKVADLQSAAGQLAEQAGKFSGRSVGPQFGSATSSLVQLLTNFDVWACGSMVTALALKHKQLVVAATHELPPDPQLDKAVQDYGNLIARLQAACDKYVYDRRAGIQPSEPGAVAVPGTDEVIEPPEEPPLRPVPERICYSRCVDLYVKYMRAEREYRNARRDADAARQSATAKQQDYAKARAEADTRRADAERTRAERARLSSVINDPKTSTSARDYAATQYGRLNPDAAEDLAKRAEAAAAAAKQAADEQAARAARAETEASALYDAMDTIYNALLACGRDCADQAKNYDKYDIDLGTLFPSMPNHVLPKPDFYRAPPGPGPAAPAAGADKAPPRRTAMAPTNATQLITTPMGLQGGLLVGTVLADDRKDDDNRTDRQVADEPPRQVAVTDPGGTTSMVAIGENGSFAISLPDAAGAVQLAVPGLAGKPLAVQLVDSVPGSLAPVPAHYCTGGQQITLGAPYREVAITTANNPEIALPSATSVAADGMSGITTFRLPPNLKPGMVQYTLTALDGTRTTVEANGYAFLSASIDQDRLRSGQNTRFTYEIAFGPGGPRKVWVTIAISGPIVYERVGQPQLIEIGPDGHGTFSDMIHALQGSPTGIPFAIIPTFYDEQEAKLLFAM